MDFALPHIHEDSVVISSNIRHIPVNVASNEEDISLDDMLVEAANQAASDLFFGLDSKEDPSTLDCTAYPERSIPQSEIIQPNSLVVIFQSFDNLKFCYAKPGDVFCNRNGSFHHDDFIGKPFGCKIRSRTNQGYGYLYLLKPTPELWARSLKHRTQIVHELDASMIVFYLNLQPNMVVCESGTGSGALSHCIMRTIAPQGMLHTYEFNEKRANTAKIEFEKNRVSHLVTVHHRDVCGKHGPGGFDRPQASVDAVVLDLPEPWAAVPYAAHCLKPNTRLASYSPCVEQAQRTVMSLKKSGFHTIKTMEFRLKEFHVDEEEFEPPPKEKRQRMVDRRRAPDVDLILSAGEDTVAEADNEKSEYETEGDQEGFLTTAEEQEDIPAATQNYHNPATAILASNSTLSKRPSPTTTATTASIGKKILVARPFNTMRGHTAFLTFATSGNKLQPHPNNKESSA
jgi:tRNA (adenine57-N1/adenine58-N1)-methyltransferase catalytic subunit